MMVAENRVVMDKKVDSQLGETCDHGKRLYVAKLLHWDCVHFRLIEP